MDIIPVIDLKGGQVVRARMGQRDQYRPIETPLSPTSDPVDVTRGLMSVFPFRTLYVADLDAIERTGSSDIVLARLSAAFPQLSLWVDNGIEDVSAAQRFLASMRGHLVIGSEVQHDVSLVESLKDDPRVILSLDFRGDTFVGPSSLPATPGIWPQRVVVMTLARVGSGAGPDIARLTQIRDVAGDRHLYAAGGVRDRDDLIAVQRAGIAGALVASALHDGRLAAAAIRGL